MLRFLLVVIVLCSASEIKAQELTVSMVGDVMMGTTFPSIMLPANDGQDLFNDTKEILTRTDLTIGNLEGAICDGGTSTKGSGPNSY